MAEEFLETYSVPALLLAEIANEMLAGDGGLGVVKACQKILMREKWVALVDQYVKGFISRISVNTQTTYAVGSDVYEVLCNQVTNTKIVFYGPKRFRAAVRRMNCAGTGQRKSVVHGEYDKYMQVYEMGLVFIKQLTRHKNVQEYVVADAASAPAFLYWLKTRCGEKGVIWTPEQGKIDSVINPVEVGIACSTIQAFDGGRVDHVLKGENGKNSVHMSNVCVNGQGHVQPDLCLKFIGQNKSVNMSCRWQVTTEPYLDSNDDFADTNGVIHEIDMGTVLLYCHMITHYKKSDSIESWDDVASLKPIANIDLSIPMSDFIKDQKMAAAVGIGRLVKRVEHLEDGTIQIVRHGMFASKRSETDPLFVKLGLWNAPDGSNEYDRQTAYDLCSDVMTIWTAKTHQQSLLSEEYKKVYNKGMTQVMNNVAGVWSARFVMRTLLRYLHDDDFRQSPLMQLCHYATLLSHHHHDGHNFEVTGRMGSTETTDLEEYEVECREKYGIDLKGRFVRVRSKPEDVDCWFRERKRIDELQAALSSQETDPSQILSAVDEKEVAPSPMTEMSDPSFTHSDELPSGGGSPSIKKVVGISTTEDRLLRYRDYVCETSFFDDACSNDVKLDDDYEIDLPIMKQALGRQEIIMADKILWMCMDSGQSTGYFIEPYPSLLKKNETGQFQFDTSSQQNKARVEPNSTPWVRARVCRRLIGAESSVQGSNLDQTATAGRAIHCIQPMIEMNMIKRTGRSRFEVMDPSRFNDAQRKKMKEIGQDANTARIHNDMVTAWTMKFENKNSGGQAGQSNGSTTTAPTKARVSRKKRKREESDDDEGNDAPQSPANKRLRVVPNGDPKPFLGNELQQNYPYGALNMATGAFDEASPF